MSSILLCAIVCAHSDGGACSTEVVHRFLEDFCTPMLINVPMYSSPWRWRQHFRTTHCHLPTAIHGVISRTNRVVLGNMARVSPVSTGSSNVPLAVCCTNFLSKSSLTTLNYSKHSAADYVILRKKHTNLSFHNHIQDVSRTSSFLCIDCQNEWNSTLSFGTEMNTQRISATLLNLTIHLHQNIYVLRQIENLRH